MRIKHLEQKQYIVGEVGVESLIPSLMNKLMTVSDRVPFDCLYVIHELKMN